MLLLIPSKELLLQQLSSQKANLIMVSLKVTLIKLNLTLVWSNQLILRDSMLQHILPFL